MDSEMEIAEKVKTCLDLVTAEYEIQTDSRLGSKQLQNSPKKCSQSPFPSPS